MKIEITYSARCKDCKFLKRATVYKKNGEVSTLKRYKCTNDKSPRANFVVSPRYFACEKFELG